MSNEIPINGRGKLAAEPRTDHQGVTIRIEDNRDPAFWAELRLTT